MKPWSCYRVCGLILKADISFPEAQRSPVNPRRVGLEFSRYTGQPIREDIEWVHQSLRPNGNPQILVGESEGSVIVRFPRLADFLVRPADRTISYLTRCKTPKTTIRHLFLDYVLPSYLARERLVLHASVVRVAEKKAIAFLGKSGSGKSTTAAVFWREGFQIISDDCAVVEQGNGSPMCVPSYPGLRLWNDSAKAVLRPGQKKSIIAHYTAKSRFKHPLMEEEFDGRTVPLSRIYWLEPARRRTRGISIRPIPGPQGLIRLVESSFRLHFREPMSLRDEFNRLARIAESNLLYSVRFPRDFRRVGELTKTILDDVGR